MTRKARRLQNRIHRTEECLAAWEGIYAARKYLIEHDKTVYICEFDISRISRAKANVNRYAIRIHNLKELLLAELRSD